MKASASGESRKEKPVEEVANSRKRVNLIDAKRAQNAGIALARIKVPFPEVKERVQLLKDDVFTTDQLRYLLVCHMIIALLGLFFISLFLPYFRQFFLPSFRLIFALFKPYFCPIFVVFLEPIQ